MLNGLQHGLAHLCRQQNIFPVESICENRSERIGEKRYKGETERRVVQIREREKEPEYQKDGRKKRIKISTDKGYAKGGGVRKRGEGMREDRQTEEGIHECL